MWKKILTVSLFFGLSLAILVALSMYSYQRFDTYVQYADAVDKHSYVLSQLGKLRLQLSELQTNERSYLLFSDSTYQDRFAKNTEAVKKIFAHIFTLVKEDRELADLLHKLNFSIRSEIDLLTTGIHVGYPPSDVHRVEAQQRKSLSLIEEMEALENERIQEELNRRKFYETTAPQNFRLIFFFALAIFAVSFGLMIKQYRDRMMYQRELEMNIAELNQANAEWEQMAYVASHDLQEPLRKIRTFSDLLQSKHMEALDDEGVLLIKRIDAASARVQSLMVDIVNYNLIVATSEELSPVDLNHILDLVTTELRLQINEKHAELFADSLPVIRAHESQMLLLFKSLIDNSLKFSKPNEPVKISVISTTVTGKELPVKQNLSFTHYHKVVIEDNGIGFDSQFADRMFRMFQRLHPQDSPYDGRGIGLALVKRIMTNHIGYVVAKGRPGKGARFILYFPVR